MCPYFKGVDRDAFERYRDLGVDRVIASLLAFDRDRLLTAADELAKELVEPAALDVARAGDALLELGDDVRAHQLDGLHDLSCGILYGFTRQSSRSTPASS